MRVYEVAFVEDGVRYVQLVRASSESEAVRKTKVRRKDSKSVVVQDKYSDPDGNERE